jgi:squalene cyclase
MQQGLLELAIPIAVISVVFFGHSLKGFPKNELGRSLGGRSTFVWGYDNLRGQWSNTAAFIFTSCFACVLHSVLPLAAVGLVFGLYAVYHFLSPMTSMPAAARASRIYRKPSWLPGARKFEGSHNWVFAEADESHRLTESEVSNGLSLSGESSGRQTWHLDDGAKREQSTFDPSVNPNTSDSVFRDQQLAKWKEARGKADKSDAKQGEATNVPKGSSKSTISAMKSASKGVDFYQKLQCDDGHWAGDYGGPHFLLPGLVVVWYVTGQEEALISQTKRKAMAHYLRCHQQADGGWGTHIESPSTMFGSTLSYVALRLLTAGENGAPATKEDAEILERGRRFLHENGGALYTASWAKFYLCVLGVMEWEGHNSIPPEMWMLPDYFPFHPGRLWCHCRMVYLPMCYLYGLRFVYDEAETDPLIRELRHELYVYGGEGEEWKAAHPYYSGGSKSAAGSKRQASPTLFDWAATSQWVAPMDNYSPIPLLMSILNDLLLYCWEDPGPTGAIGSGTWRWLQLSPLAPLFWLRSCVRDFLRAKGLALALDYMHAEDEQTNYVNIGPVNKVLNMLSSFAAARLAENAGDADEDGSHHHANATRAAGYRATQAISVSAKAKKGFGRTVKQAVASRPFQRHLLRVADYLWVSEDGMKMQGYNGAQCWDTSFALQAVGECGLLDRFPSMTRKAYHYMERTQILSTEVSKGSPANAYETPEMREKYYRHVSRGGWPFSTSAHGWPISDCTAEGLKSVLLVHSMKPLCMLEEVSTAAEADADGAAHAKRCAQDYDKMLAVASAGGRGADSAAIEAKACMAVSVEALTVVRMEGAVEVLLALQNNEGGWATYENTRGYGWYEELNPSEVFGDIMIDYCYIECSMASLSALVAFAQAHPRHTRVMSGEVPDSIARGRKFIRSIQREDGSWYGSWACCFTYGCWFGLEALSLPTPNTSGEASVTRNADGHEAHFPGIAHADGATATALRRGCAFLLGKQNANGGWGEDFTSCFDRDYAANGMQTWGDKEGSGVVPTAWALLGLMAAQCGDDDVPGAKEAVRRGIEYLQQRQLPSGDWPQEGVAGVFNRAVAISYTQYRNVFPIWALGRYARHYNHKS